MSFAGGEEQAQGRGVGKGKKVASDEESACQE